MLLLSRQTLLTPSGISIFFSMTIFNAKHLPDATHWDFDELNDRRDPGDIVNLSPCPPYLHLHSGPSSKLRASPLPFFSFGRKSCTEIIMTVARRPPQNLIGWIAWDPNGPWDTELSALGPHTRDSRTHTNTHACGNSPVNGEFFSGDQGRDSVSQPALSNLWDSIRWIREERPCLQPLVQRLCRTTPPATILDDVPAGSLDDVICIEWTSGTTGPMAFC